MANIFGVLGVNDTDYIFNQNVNQRAIFDVARQWLAAHNEEMARFEAVFADPSPTDLIKERYKLPGGGRLQRLGSQSQPGAVKPLGSWDVGYPLESFGAQVAISQEDWAYMDAASFSLAMENVQAQDLATRRYEMLRRLLNNTQRSFSDPRHGAILVEPLANGDSVVYPPIIGSEAEATENLYLESGYAASGISDTNDPYVTMGQKFINHYGQVQGGRNVVFFINSAQIAKTQALAMFYDTPITAIEYGANADLARLIPATPGVIIGRHAYGWVAVWDFIPANYIVAIDLDAPKPLKKRVDPPGVGLGGGNLQIVGMDEEFPFTEWFWRIRFGYGVSNRLNGVVMELGTGGAYTVPTGFTY